MYSSVRAMFSKRKQLHTQTVHGSCLPILGISKAGQNKKRSLPGHAGLCHEDEVHVAGDDRNLRHMVHISGGLCWLALCQQQIQQQLKVRFPVGGLTNQKQRLHAGEVGVLFVLTPCLQQKWSVYLFLYCSFLFLNFVLVVVVESDSFVYSSMLP